MNRTRIALLVAAALTGVYVFLVSPLDQKRAEVSEELGARYISLQKRENFIKRTEKAGVELKEALKELKDMEQYIVKSSDTPLAFADLQTRVQDIADESGLSVRSIKPLPTVAYKGYTGLPIFMDAMGGIGDLSRFLNHLDSTWEFISIDSLNITTTRQDQLRIRVQLSGLMRST